MLLDGAVDLILSTKLEHPQIEAAYIGTHRLVLLVPEGHRLAGKGCVDLKELDGENYIAFDPSGQLRSQLDGDIERPDYSWNGCSQTGGGYCTISTFRGAI